MGATTSPPRSAPGSASKLIEQMSRSLSALGFVIVDVPISARAHLDALRHCADEAARVAGLTIGSSIAEIEVGFIRIIVTVEDASAPA